MKISDIIFKRIPSSISLLFENVYDSYSYLPRYPKVLHTPGGPDRLKSQCQDAPEKRRQGWLPRKAGTYRYWATHKPHPTIKKSSGNLVMTFSASSLCNSFPSTELHRLLSNFGTDSQFHLPQTRHSRSGLNRYDLERKHLVYLVWIHVGCSVPLDS